MNSPSSASHRTSTLADLAPRLTEGFGTEISITTARLSNGIETVVLTSPTAPLMSTQLVLNCGNRDVPEDRGGLAHCVEHMMFKIPGLSMDEEIEDLGGSCNAYTTQDGTGYLTDSLPGALDTILALERRRFGKTEIAPASLEAELQVILEERLQAVENSPIGTVFEEIYALAYPGHPYGRSILGTPADLEQTTVEDCRRFIASQYVPERMALIVAGPLVSSKVIDLAEESLGQLPPGQENTVRFASTAPSNPAQHLSLCKKAELSAVSLATVVGRPGLSEPRESAAAELLTVILTWGDSSRLIRSLVHERRIAFDIEAGLQEYELGSLLLIEARSPDRRDPSGLRDAIQKELHSLAEIPISEEEIEKAKRILAIETVKLMRTSSSQADLVSGIHLLHGCAQAGIRSLETFLDVTAHDIAQLAEKVTRSDETVCVSLQASESE